MLSFRAPSQSLGALDSTAAAELIGAAADIAIVLDGRGVIRDICVGGDELIAHDLLQWVGTSWEETVSVDSQHKVREFLDDELAANAPAQRQVNQILPDGSNLLILYSVVALSQPGYRVAIGKDMSALERLQQKLVNVQHHMERDYLRMREFEMRYRYLFRTAPEAIMIAERDDLRIIEANPTACSRCGLTERRILSRRLPQCFAEPSRSALVKLIGKLENRGQAEEIEVTLRSSAEVLVATVSAFNADNVGHVLIRLSTLPADLETVEVAPGQQDEHMQRLGLLVEQAPDALVVTDPEGRVLIANSAFLDIAQLVSTEAAAGQSLSRWLGYDTVDYQVIMSSLTEHGSIRLYSTRTRGEFGSLIEVEVSAVVMDTADGSCFGFSIRNISRRAQAANDDASPGTGLTRSEDQLTQLVGRVPLKELVRESTELIEQLCIEAALRMTGNNRASAAEVLGLSRQSLYVKLRRYDMDGESED
jgi:transcriptional regulator PpsR